MISRTVGTNTPAAAPVAQDHPRTAPMRAAIFSMFSMLRKRPHKVRSPRAGERLLRGRLTVVVLEDRTVPAAPVLGARGFDVPMSTDGAPAVAAPELALVEDSPPLP